MQRSAHRAHKLDTRKIHFVLKIIIYLILLIFPIFAVYLRVSCCNFFVIPFAKRHFFIVVCFALCCFFSFLHRRCCCFFRCALFCLSNCSFVLTRSKQKVEQERMAASETECELRSMKKESQIQSKPKDWR